ARELAPSRTDLPRATALIQAHAGRADACRQTCARMLASPENTAAQALLLLHPAPHDPLSRAAAAVLVCRPPRLQPLEAARTFGTVGALAPEPARWPALPAGNTPSHRTTRGGLLLRQGKYDEAVKQLTGLESPDAWLLLALAEQGRGKSNEARASLERFT